MPDWLESSETINASIDHARQELSTLVEQTYTRLNVLGTELIQSAFDRFDGSIRLFFDRLENIVVTIGKK